MLQQNKNLFSSKNMIGWYEKKHIRIEHGIIVIYYPYLMPRRLLFAPIFYEWYQRLFFQVFDDHRFIPSAFGRPECNYALPCREWWCLSPVMSRLLQVSTQIRSQDVMWVVLSVCMWDCDKFSTCSLHPTQNYNVVVSAVPARTGRWDVYTLFQTNTY